MIFNEDIYHNLIVSFLVGQDQLNAYHCEARIIFPHAHHFTFTYTEFYLPFHCSVTLSCKVFRQLFAVSPFPYCPEELQNNSKADHLTAHLLCQVIYESVEQHQSQDRSHPVVTSLYSIS